MNPRLETPRSFPTAGFGPPASDCLSSTGLLGKFDYPFTVSGGGYIGRWFTAWARNHPKCQAGVIVELSAPPSDSLPPARTWRRNGPLHVALPLFNEVFGNTTDACPYVNLSDGRHFNNLSLYEIVLRRCRHVVVVDAVAISVTCSRIWEMPSARFASILES